MADFVAFTQTILTVRKGIEKDLEKIGQYLGSSTTEVCLPHLARHERNSLMMPPEMDSKQERFYVVEKAEEIIGHFVVWSEDNKNKWIQVVAAFSGTCQEHEAEEACRLFFDSMFHEKHVHKIMFMVHPEASFFFRLARFLGLFLEGTLRKHIVLDGSWYDLCVFSVLTTDSVPGEIPVSKDLKYGWLLERARYDEVDVLVVRAVILKIQPKQIEVLLIRRTKNASLPGVEETPGGRMLEGESIQNALQREVRETVGLEIEEEVSFLTSFDFTSADGKKVREFVFRVTPSSWDVVLCDKEYGSFCWLPLTSLPQTKLHPDMVQILSSYSPIVPYETLFSLPHEGNASIELIRPPSIKLEEALLSGLHLDAYAARGLSVVDSLCFSLLDGTNKIVGGVLLDLAYGCLILKRLWIDPAWRRRGWGKKLVKRAESLAKEKGCAFALAYVMDWEEVPFFQKLGYFIEGQELGFSSDARMYRVRKELMNTTS